MLVQTNLILMRFIFYIDEIDDDSFTNEINSYYIVIRVMFVYIT